MVNMKNSFLFIKTFSKIFSQNKWQRLYGFGGILSIQTKICKFPTGNLPWIASTACVYTQGKIASTASVMTLAEFLQIFPKEHLQKLACIRENSLTPFLLRNQNFSAKKCAIIENIFSITAHLYMQNPYILFNSHPWRYNHSLHLTCSLI